MSRISITQGLIGVVLVVLLGCTPPGGGPDGPTPGPSGTPTPNQGEPPLHGVGFTQENPYISVIPAPGVVSVASNGSGTYAVLTAVGDGNLEYVGVTDGGSFVSGTLPTTPGTYCPDRATIVSGPNDDFRVVYIAETVDAGGCGSNSMAAAAVMNVTATGNGNLSAGAPDTSRLSTMNAFVDLAATSDPSGNVYLIGNGDGVGAPTQTVDEPGQGDTSLSQYDSSYPIVSMDVAKTGNPAGIAAYSIFGAGALPKYFLSTTPGNWVDITAGTPDTLLGERMGAAMWDADNYAIAYAQDDGMNQAIRADISKDGARITGITVFSATMTTGFLGQLKLVAAGLTTAGDVVYYAFWAREDAMYNAYFSVSDDGGETWDPPTRINTDDMIYIQWLDAAYNADTQEIHVWWVGESVTGMNGESVFYTVGTGS